ncbi:MAG: hypothetical protein ACI8RD_001582 [Bacillariaceae sp.]|jgi:hypothetical protein
MMMQLQLQLLSLSLLLSLASAWTNPNRAVVSSRGVRTALYSESELNPCWQDIYDAGELRKQNAKATTM